MHPDFVYTRTKEYEEIKAMKQMVTTMTQEVGALSEGNEAESN